MKALKTCGLLVCSAARVLARPRSRSTCCVAVGPRTFLPCNFLPNPPAPSQPPPPQKKKQTRTRITLCAGGPHHGALGSGVLRINPNLRFLRPGHWLDCHLTEPRQSEHNQLISFVVSAQLADPPAYDCASMRVAWAPRKCLFLFGFMLKTDPSPTRVPSAKITHTQRGAIPAKTSRTAHVTTTVSESWVPDCSTL